MQTRRKMRSPLPAIANLYYVFVSMSCQNALYHFRIPVSASSAYKTPLVLGTSSRPVLEMASLMASARALNADSDLRVRGSEWMLVYD